MLSFFHKLFKRIWDPIMSKIMKKVFFAVSIMVVS
jgi:hypothetical protein